MSKEICNCCDLAFKNDRHGKCDAPSAEPIDGASDVELPHNCRHFTCSVGLRAARQVVHTLNDQLNPVVVTINGVEYCGYPFGSNEKPYHSTGRLVTRDGIILTKGANREDYCIYPVRATYCP